MTMPFIYGGLFASISAENIKVPVHVREEIHERAQQEWPGNYSMQAHEIDIQTKDYKELHAWFKNNATNKLAKEIFQKAQTEWPGNYSMQWYEVKRELEALHEIHGSG